MVVWVRNGPVGNLLVWFIVCLVVERGKDVESSSSFSLFILAICCLCTIYENMPRFLRSNLLIPRAFGVA